MESVLEIECLACGSRRKVTGSGRAEVGECRDCGYVGWAPVQSLDDGERIVLHQRLNRVLSEQHWPACGRL